MSGSDLLSVPGKRAADIDMTKALKTLIASTFASANQSSQSGMLKDVEGTLKELQRLRVNALLKGGEKGEQPFNAVASYVLVASSKIRGSFKGGGFGTRS